MATTGALNANYYDLEGHRWKVNVNFNYVSPTMNLTPQSDFSDIPVKWGNIANAFNGRTSYCDISTTYINGDVSSMDHVTNAYNAYASSTAMTGQPHCADTFENASRMYAYCQNITGSPVVGSNVTDASWMYVNCYNITGTPVVGSNVVNALELYDNCRNLTGPFTISDSVEIARVMYARCPNIVGPVVFSNNQRNGEYMYQECTNITGLNNIYSENLNNLSYAFYTSVKPTSLNPWGGVYEWHCDNCRFINMWYPGDSMRPTEHWNATHIIINQTYENGVNTMSFNNLKTVNEPVDGWTLADISAHKVLGLKGSGNLWIHYNNEWNYHNESKLIDDIEYVDIYGYNRGAYGSVSTGYTDFIIYTPSPGKNQYFVDNGEHMRFVESDRQWYNGTTTSALTANVHYKNGETKEYPYIRAYLSNWVHSYGRGIQANTEVLIHGPHEIFSDIDHKYPPKVYFNGDFYDMFSGASRMTKYPSFCVSDDYPVDYSDCFSKINNMCNFFNGCANMREQPKDWAGWQALEHGRVNVARMFSNCNNLYGAPFLHENMDNNLQDMYAYTNGIMEGFCDIPNFTYAIEYGKFNMRAPWWCSTCSDKSTHHNFACGIYNCYCDNLTYVQDWFNFGSNVAPSMFRNALHLKINMYEVDGVTLTHTYNSFKSNTQDSRSTVDDTKNGWFRWANENFFVHYNPGWTYDSERKAVKRLVVNMNQHRPWNSLSGTRGYFKYCKAGYDCNIMPIEGMPFIYAWGESADWGRIRCEAELEDGTTYLFNSTFTPGDSGRSLTTHGWPDSSCTVLALPPCVMSEQPGHEWRPEKIVFSGPMDYYYEGSAIDKLKVFNFGAGDNGEETYALVNNGRNMFRSCSSLLTAPDNMNFGLMQDINGMFDSTSKMVANGASWNFASATKCYETFWLCSNMNSMPNLPNANYMYGTFYNCTGWDEDVTGKNFGIDDGTLTNMQRAFSGCTNITGELYLPYVTDGNHYYLCDNCFNLSSARFNSDAKLVNCYKIFWECGTYSDFNVYLPNTICSDFTGFIGYQSTTTRLEKCKHELHLYDPYCDYPDLWKTSPWWTHVSNSGKLTYTGRMFSYWDGSAQQVTTVTWVDYTDKGYLFNAQYNMYYHYANVSLAEIPLPEGLKAQFAAGDVTSFVTT